MANDSADFSVRLHDELTGPARAMRAELKGLLGDLKKFDVGTRAGGGGAQRQRRATDGIKEPKFLTANDRIRIQEREEKTAAKAAAAERKQQERAAKAQERESAQLRKLMARDEKAKLASVARQDKAYMRAAKAQQSAMEKADKQAKSAAKAQERERDKQIRKERQAESRRLADMAHNKVLAGGVGGGVKRGGALNDAVETLVSKTGLKALVAGGAVAAGIGLIVSGLGAIKDAAVGAAVGVVRLAQSFAQSSIEAMRFAQSSETALGNLLHSGTNVRKEFDSVRGMAQDLGLDVEDTVHSFQKLLAAQFDVGRSKELLAMGADLQGIGATADQVGRALLAITQIKSKGRLMASEMLQLQEAGISSELVYDALGKRLGKTREELRKLQEAGQLDAGIGIDAILAAVRKKTGTTEAGELGRKVARSTLDGMMRTLDAGITNMFVDVGRRLEPIVMPIAMKVIGVFDLIRNHPGLQVLGDVIINRLGRMAAWVDENWPRIEAALVSGLDSAANAGLGMIRVADYIVDHWGEVEPVLIAIGAALSPIALGVGLIGVAFASAMVPIVGFWLILKKVGDAMEKIARFAHLKIWGKTVLGATPEKIEEDRRKKNEAEKLKVGGIAANDNAKPWWTQDQRHDDEAMAVNRTPIGALLGTRTDAQATIAPAKASPRTMAPNVSPIRDAAEAQSAAAAEQSAAATDTRAAVNELRQAAQALTAASAQLGNSGSGGGESDLIGMLEAV